MHITGDADGPPMPTGIALADNNAGFHAFAGLGYALYHRSRTGRGCHIDISMVEALFHMQEHAVHAPSMDPEQRSERQGPHYGPLSPAGVFKGPEGWIVILCTDLQIGGLWQAMERSDLGTDERFAMPIARIEHRKALTDEIEGWMAGFESDVDVLAKLEEFRVPCGPVLDPADAVNHPFFVERRAIRQVTDPLLGTVDIPGFPLKFSDAPPELDLPVHALGQDNTDVLVDLLGYDKQQIDALEADGVIASKQH